MTDDSNSDDVNPGNSKKKNVILKHDEVMDIAKRLSACFKRDKNFATMACGFLIHLVDVGENINVDEFTNNANDLVHLILRNTDYDYAITTLNVINEERFMIKQRVNSQQ